MLTNDNKTLKSDFIETPIGRMLAIADDNSLYLLEFIDKKNIEDEIKKLSIKAKLSVIEGRTSIINLIENELNQYFAVKLRDFKTPIAMFGTSFQQIVWNALKVIPHGQTRSYKQIATAIGKPKAFRAVAQANGANQIAIVIPCHRVINTNGSLGGYSAGLSRKNNLINLEKQN